MHPNSFKYLAAPSISLTAPYQSKPLSRWPASWNYSRTKKWYFSILCNFSSVYIWRDALESFLSKLVSSFDHWFIQAPPFLDDDDTILRIILVQITFIEFKNTLLHLVYHLLWMCNFFWLECEVVNRLTLFNNILWNLIENSEKIYKKWNQFISLSPFFLIWLM